MALVSEQFNRSRGYQNDFFYFPYKVHCCSQLISYYTNKLKERRMFLNGEAMINGLLTAQNDKNNSII